MAAYVAAAALGLPRDQLSGADRGLIAVLGWFGVVAVAGGMLGSIASVTRLLHRVVVAVGILASVGILQFAIGLNIADLVHVPGLTANTALDFIGQRSDFRRVSGTTLHPIEFGMVLATALPLALHFGLVDVHRALWRRWLPAVVISVALPMSLSRSAILGLLVALVILFVAWDGLRRTVMLIVVPVAAVLMRIAIPGLLGTIRSLFTGLSGDPSIQGRTDDYAVVGAFISQNPFFGRGFGTFLPKDFIVLDNQYLGQLVETGVIGLVALIGLFVVGFICARGVRRRAGSTEVEDLAIALSASVAVVGMGFVTFDGLGFPMITGLLFLVLGCISALWRLTGGRRTIPLCVDAPTRSPTKESGRGE